MSSRAQEALHPAPSVILPMLLATPNLKEMAIRCLLFSSDEGTATPILQALAALDVEGEHCSEAAAAVEKVTHQSFQIVIIDWDTQPEAARLLRAARERKAAERPLTLAIVSNDISVPAALQAGANSILRKPILDSQVTDTLTTARDLLRAKQESAATVAQAAAAGASSGSTTTLPASVAPGTERALRAGEFLQSAPPAPGAQFETESNLHESLQPTSVEPVDPLKDLEPMAASVAEEKPVPGPPPPLPPSEPRGLEWYIKTRGGTLPAIPFPAPPPQSPAKAELLGFETSSYSPPPAASSDDSAPGSSTEAKPLPPTAREQKREQKKEAELFAYMAGESNESEQAPRSGFRFKGAIIAALVLAACAIVAAPQAPWHPKMRVAWAGGQRALRGWLNPQPVAPVQAPIAHEDFGRAGDEYKLPVAESIPDATTDPSQIQVVPVVDPTIKKPNNMGANAEPAVQAEPASATPADQTPPSGTQVPASTPETVQPVSGPGGGGTLASPGSAPLPAPAVVAPPTPAPHSDPPAIPQPSASSGPFVPLHPAPKNPPPHNAPPAGSVPSSLKSQMASMTPDASGNKPPEAAMQSIEPVSVSEAAERALLTDQPALDYPASAGVQHGTVVLQVLIGRDGTVQDAKFLQGSLAFARSAINGVKQWKFKPYAMNGRPVSVQTQFTIVFKPAP
jgi:protein TonB